MKSNREAPCFNGITLDKCSSHYRECWREISTIILGGKYKPQPVLRVEIENPDGSPCPLGIPNVLDRIIEEAIPQVIGPAFDSQFSEPSFGFRPDKSGHSIVRQVQLFIREGRKIAADADLCEFFDRIAHDVSSWQRCHVG